MPKGQSGRNGLTTGGYSLAARASDFHPDPNKITLAKNASLDGLPQRLWAFAATDKRCHQVPRTALFWDKGVLKTQKLGQILELAKENPRTQEAPVFGRGVLERVQATGRNLVLLSLRPNEGDDGGGHAMAAFRSGDQYTIFDPNGGSATFPDYASAEAFFEEYWHSGTIPYSETFDDFTAIGYQ